jgi:hypothetical protein
MTVDSFYRLFFNNLRNRPRHRKEGRAIYCKLEPLKMNAIQKEVEKAVEGAGNVRTDIALVSKEGKVNLTAIPSAARQTSYKAILEAYDAYHRKGGVADLEKALEVYVQTHYAAQVLIILNQAVDVSVVDVNGKATPNLKIAHAVAVELFDWSETQLRSRHTDKQTGKAPTIAEMLPGWPSYKSNGLKTLMAGINPQAEDPDSEELKYPTLGAYVKAGPKGASEKSDKEDSDKVFTITTTNLIPELAGVMKALGESVHGCPKELQPEVTRILTLTVNTVATMIADFQQKQTAAGDAIADAMRRPVAQATTGSPEADAEAAAVIAAQKAAEGKETRKRGGKRI